MKRIYFWYTLTLVLFTSITVFALSQNDKDETNEEAKNVNITFENIDDPKVQDAFEEVFEAYEVLHDYPITLVQKKMKKTTMVAQPVLTLSTLFGGKKEFQIKLGHHVRDVDELVISQLPKNVLKGWFAHELGHIVDYEKRSSLGMVGYGIKYSTSEKFKKEVEHEADSIAINHGFFKELIATKRFLLEHELVTKSYKDQLKRYYMPIKGVEMCIEDKELLMPISD